MDRRKFNKLILGAPLLLASPKTLPAISGPYGIRIKKPPRLQKGDKVGLIAPASAATQEKFEKAIFNIESLGLKVSVGTYAHEKTGFLAGDDDKRLSDLHRMFEEDSIKAIWAVRGGYGTTRLIPRLNYRMIRKHPKILIGYSDITALSNAIFARSGVVGFHGPVASSDFTDYNLEYLQKVLFEGHVKLTVQIGYANSNNVSDAYRQQVITPGHMKGHLAGGNLSLLSAMVGTGYLPDFNRKIVFIEDIGEKPYRIDRMLTQLLTSTNLAKASGILLGIFEDCETDDPENSWTLQEVLRDRLGKLGMPVFYGFPIGHIQDQATIPIGITAKFDTTSRELIYLESPVK
ncbi:MAG TPA: LD-carboxypeptidase [Saprospiraceae bacterium]|nr:LD-carboxypeptidase [Saprospiraceae bacterium]